MKKEKQKKVVGYRWKNQGKGVGQFRYQELRRRQVKIETEMWEEVAKEYRELLMDMCEHKLAPNLPYMKSLFLGWFEPLRDAIVKEQEMYSEGKNRTTYAPYFVQLSADKMVVISMHKLMGLLMTGTKHVTIATARVVQAACGISDAIENEVKDALAVLQKLIHTANEEVVSDACWALYHLSDGPEDQIQAIIAGVCPKLVELLQHSSVVVISPALQTLGNIVTGDDAQKQIVIDNQVLPGLYQLHMRGNRKSIRIEACLAISNITSCNEAQIEASLRPILFLNLFKFFNKMS